jgi:hypothetical protein
MKLCRKCGTRLTPVEEGQEYHPLCFPDHVKLPGTPMTLFEMGIREDLIEMILWGNHDAPRSQQIELGCSEAGDPCERKIAMKMANIPTVNFPDPIKANMGTAYHEWLDKTMAKFQATHDMNEWVTETEVFPADFLKGHVDLYSRKRRTVLDWKTTSAERAREWKKNGSLPEDKLIQVLLYGKGMINAGFRVDRVGIVGISRSGSLRDIVVLTEEYDEDKAVEALRRVWRIGKQITVLDVENHPENFAQVPASPSRLCGWCPFYRGGSKSADASGCPGKTTGDPVSDLFQ